MGDYFNYADFGASYTLPTWLTYGDSSTRTYLAGVFANWNPVEIEVYQLSY